jgi:hypothetical protein
MNPEDPIQQLEAYYQRLHHAPAPALSVAKPIRWWEVAGGLVAGAAAVVIAVTLCLSGGDSKAPTMGLTEHQMRVAGMNPIEAPRRRAQREAPWHA